MSSIVSGVHLCGVMPENSGIFSCCRAVATKQGVDIEACEVFNIHGMVKFQIAAVTRKGVPTWNIHQLYKSTSAFVDRFSKYPVQLTISLSPCVMACLNCAPSTWFAQNATFEWLMTNTKWQSWYFGETSLIPLFTARLYQRSVV